MLSFWIHVVCVSSLNQQHLNYLALREKCPNAEFYLVPIFLHLTVASEVISNIVSVWICEHFPLFFVFLFEVCDWEKILVNLWLLRQEGKHPTGWIKCLRKKEHPKKWKKQLSDGIKNLVKKINDGKSGEHKKYFMKIKFNPFKWNIKTS